MGDNKNYIRAHSHFPGKIFSLGARFLGVQTKQEIAMLKQQNSDFRDIINLLKKLEKPEE